MHTPDTERQQQLGGQLHSLSQDWWKSAVVYQIYPRSFADSNGDGIGDLRGIINRLDYLELLGVDVVWLSPIFRSPQDDNGYDISDYQDIDPVFGTLAEVDELIAGLHGRGIKLVMDLVVNHTSDEHAWFIESRDVTSPKRDWYWWRPAREGHIAGTPGAEPNDWQAYFSGSAWQYDEQRGEYFLHQFSKKQPDLNWENPDVRAAVYAMMQWWLDRGVDGFRMDVINLISKNIALPDGNTFSNCANGPRLHEFLQEMHREVLAGRNLITVGEAPGASIEVARLCSDATRAELNMVFTFEHMDLDVLPGGSKWDFAPLQLTKLKANLNAWQHGLADSGWNSLYWNNHDQPRIVSRWGNDGEHRIASAKALGTVLHLLRGTPYIYEGEEIGMTNAGFTSLSEYRDLESLNWAADAQRAGRSDDSILQSLAVKSRDNARTPMQWDTSEHAGFSTVTPWLRSNPNSSSINVAAAVADPDSVFHHYRRLISLRHELPVVVHGDFTPLFDDHEQVFAYVRSLGSTRLLVLANLSDTAATLPMDDGLATFAGLSARIGDGVVWHDTSIELAPWAAAAF
jgi:oligo-1,6-glucosidase